MKTFVFISICFLLTISVSAQNGTYNCKRQEYRTVNLSENKVNHNKCKVTIQIFGIGGEDYINAEIISKNSTDTITYKWKVSNEIQMAPDAKGKRIFRSYIGTLIEGDMKNKDYQITVIRRMKGKKVSFAAIDADGAAYWFFDLDKIN